MSSQELRLCALASRQEDALVTLLEALSQAQHAQGLQSSSTHRRDDRISGAPVRATVAPFGTSDCGSHASDTLKQTTAHTVSPVPPFKPKLTQRRAMAGQVAARLLLTPATEGSFNNKRRRQAVASQPNTEGQVALLAKEVVQLRMRVQQLEALLLCQMQQQQPGRAASLPPCNPYQ